MLSIRLTRVGKKKAPVYRIVVMPKHTDPWAPSTEILGHYDPRKTPKEFVIKADRLNYWIAQGAQATDTVWNLLVDQKVIEGKKRSTSHISGSHAAKIETKAAESKKKSEDAAAKAVKVAEDAKAAADQAKAEAAQAKADAEAAAAAEAAKPAEEPVIETTETPKEEPAA